MDLPFFISLFQTQTQLPVGMCEINGNVKNVAPLACYDTDGCHINQNSGDQESSCLRKYTKF